MEEKVDQVLQALLSAVEESDQGESEVAFHVPVTISCGGLLVSGELISRAEYVRAVEKEIRAWIEEVPSMPRPIEAVGTSVAAFVGVALDSEGAGDVRDRSFVHMRARFHPSGTSPSLPGEPVLWRCAASAVQGFSLGALPFPEEAQGQDGSRGAA